MEMARLLDLPRSEDVFGTVNLNSHVSFFFRSKTVSGLISYSRGIYRAKH